MKNSYSNLGEQLRKLAVLLDNFDNKETNRSNKIDLLKILDNELKNINLDFKVKDRKEIIIFDKNSEIYSDNLDIYATIIVNDKFIVNDDILWKQAEILEMRELGYDI